MNKSLTYPENTWLEKSDFVSSNRLKLIKSGSEYFKALLDLINNTEFELILQSYIFKDDQTGTMIAEALIEAADRGVQVYLMLDAYGSGRLSSDFLKKLTDNGVRFKWFGRFINRTLSSGRRLHHKVTVADSKKVLLGGINISDNYNDTFQEPAWLDLAILIEGSLALKAKKRCMNIWEKRYFKSSLSYEEFSESAWIALRVNDSLRGKNDISTRIESAINHAKEEIIILGAYYMPTSSLRASLQKATLRGVKIKVILGKVSDVFLFRNASRYLYDWMIRHHFEIYEYPVTVVHGKAIIVDRYWVSLGSYNLNYLSSFLSIEMNAEIYDKNFGLELHHYLITLIERHCIKINKKEFRINIFQRLLNWLSYQSIRLALQADYALSRKQ